MDGKLILGDNTTLIFDGDQTNLWLENGSQVILGNNALIKFRNSAFLYANGATFNNPNGKLAGHNV
jgi:hypothetical protein